MSTRNRYFALRHGESEANRDGAIRSDPSTACDAYGLTEVGRGQVRASVSASELGPDALIYSSDFRRARETAEIARALLGALPVTLNERLRERFFGAFEGTSNANYQTVWDRDREDPGQTEDGVESVMSVLGRTSSLVAELELEHVGKTIVFVAHGDPLQIMQTGFLSVNPAEHRGLPPLTTAELRELRPIAQ